MTAQANQAETFKEIKLPLAGGTVFANLTATAEPTTFNQMLWMLNTMVNHMVPELDELIANPGAGHQTKTGSLTQVFAGSSSGNVRVRLHVVLDDFVDNAKLQRILGHGLAEAHLLVSIMDRAEEQSLDEELAHATAGAGLNPHLSRITGMLQSLLPPGAGIDLGGLMGDILGGALPQEVHLDFPLPFFNLREETPGPDGDNLG